MRNIEIQDIIENYLCRRSVLSYLLFPLSLINLVLQSLRSFLFRRKNFSGGTKIISIGNIVSGGAGKTPTTVKTAQLLQKAGYEVAVSHRGYKGKFENNTTLISDRSGLFDFAPDAGDEAYMIAESLPGIPVTAGKNRTEAVKLLNEKYKLDYIILDDSFQHLKVKHHFDVIVFNSVSGTGNGFLLPAGILRESLRALKFADIVLMNGEEDIKLPAYSYKKFRASYELSCLHDSQGNIYIQDEVKNKRICLLSGIGIPKSFEKSVVKAGIKFEKHFRLPDHADFVKSGIIKKMNDLFEADKFDYLLVTEKDYAKLRFIPAIKFPYIVFKTTFNIMGEERYIREFI
ncbi:MAG: tetraacyldisaccharide 4'-kinase [Candidatus Cloacimonadota bacterium]|nr:MAG: tetraacyldisaccharide 4'-kinase [Candidatus Cloacimonadota bacterium]